MKSKRLVIDGRHLYISGIGTYTNNLLTTYANLAMPLPTCVLAKKQYTKSLQANFPFQIQTFNPSIYSVKEQFRFLSITKSSDLLHVPHYNAPLLFQGKLIVTLHDLCHIALKEFFSSPLQRAYSSSFLPLILKKANHIITVSQFSKNEILRYFPKIKEEKITTIPLGRDEFFFPRDPESSKIVRAKYGLAKDYFITVGNYKEHKNLDGLLRIYKKAMQQNRELPDLAFVGQGNAKGVYMQSLFAYITRNRMQDKVHFISNVSYNDLPYLYTEAKALLFPSLYEGFGLPLLEAMSCETPIICSNRASIPEVVGDAAYILPPEDIESWVNALLTIENTQEYVAKARKQRAKFSWNTAAEQHIAIYNQYKD